MSINITVLNENFEVVAKNKTAAEVANMLDVAEVRVYKNSQEGWALKGYHLVRAGDTEGINGVLYRAVKAAMKGKEASGVKAALQSCLAELGRVEEANDE